MNILPNILIFSVFQKDLSEEQNKRSHEHALQVLKANLIPHTVLHGQYNGVAELSILVPSFKHRETVETICKAFSQESYLESHNDRFTNLVFMDGSRKPIGTLKGVSRAEAMARDSWSYSPLVDQFYVTV